MAKATIDDVEVGGKRVLLRVDFNVPIRGEGIADDRRIRAAVPTIESLRSRGARVVVVTHLGRPKGRVDDSLRLTLVASRLAELLGAEVKLAGDVVGADAHRVVGSLQDGDVAMLENVRFEPGEEANDASFAQQLASLADLYVNDAFGAAHRAHASTVGVAHLLPAVAGLLMARELDVLSGVLERPRRPVLAIIGGAKISTKIGVLNNLLDRVDALWVGGAMACMFFRALGEATGASLVEEDQVDTARELLRKSHLKRAELKLPVDAVVAPRVADDAPTTVVSWQQIPAGEMVVDIGPQTVDRIALDCQGAGSVVWNGPLGIYEVAAFARGTMAVAHAVARSGAVSVAGGGDLAAALQDAGVADKISHISTGGGATIEYLEGKALPGVSALRDREAAPA